MSSNLLDMPRQFAEDLAKPFLGREEQARLITIALMTREHLVMIGEPGTAKSALVRRAAELLNAKFFMYLLTKYTEPSELFGPIDIIAFKQGIYKRITEGRLPEAEIAFLDEIFNANSSILNTLLSILNERVIYDRTPIQVPLWSLFAASNNVPDEKELAALYDRILLRDFVTPLDETLWTKMLRKGMELEYYPIKSERKYTLEQFKQIYNMLPSVNVEPVISKLAKILGIVTNKGVFVSDRRKGKLIKIVAANAILNGRTYATEDDLMVLANVLSSTKDDYAIIRAVLIEHVQSSEKYLYELKEIENNLNEIQKKLDTPESDMSSLTDLIRSLRAARERVEAMKKEALSDEVRKRADQVIGLIDQLVDKAGKKLTLI